MKRRWLKNGEPLLQMWMGNFFEPWLSDRKQVQAGLEHIRALGFNTVNLDSKATEDFFARAAGGPANDYVAMQEYMMTAMHALGMAHSFLAIYLCGDNLYPHISDSAPVFGETAKGVNGQSLNTYKCWSPKAHQVMADHVRNLLRLYRAGHAQFADGPHSLPVQTMFDPILKPSFDTEGRTRYLAWLRRRYAGDIDAFNARYGLQAAKFEDLKPEEYWLRPEEISWIGGALPTPEDFANRTASLVKWIDNQAWLVEETATFFREMKAEYRALDPAIFIGPVLNQWGLFFNPITTDPREPGLCAAARGWCSAPRAVDPWMFRHELDDGLIIASPVHPEGFADPYVLSVEHSCARSLADGGSFLAGLYLGRHAFGDVYATLSPAEALAGTALHGGCGLHVYGYSGLDDGGVMARMDDVFNSSVQTGVEWLRTVMPRTGARRRGDVAILFPRALHLLEPALLRDSDRHHADLLGWFRQLSDLGYQPDILHPEQVKEGQLAQYRALIVPADPPYDLAPDAELEKTLRAWMDAGGVCLRGPGPDPVRQACGIREEAHPFDCIAWRELVIPHGWSTVTFANGEALASYGQDGRPALVQHACGRGRVISFGFEYGCAYARRSMPSVPGNYGRREAHPVIMLRESPAGVLLQDVVAPHWCGGRGVEAGWFENGVVVVNHRTIPVDLPGLPAGRRTWQIANGEKLMPHSAVWIETGAGKAEL